jgi:phage terminase large subunit-like protein
MNRALIYSGSGEERIVFEHTAEGEMFPIAADYDGLQGLNFSVALIDEVGFIDFSAWEALDSGEGKRSRSLILGLGTRRPDNVPNALDTLLDRVDQHGGIDGLLVTDYHAQPPAHGKEVDPTDRREWRRANPGLVDGYLRESTLEALLAKLGRDRFTCLRLNVKTGSQSGWLGADGPSLWKACRDPYHMVNGAPTWVGVDVSMHHDCTAVAHVQQRPDGRLYVACRIWEPGPNQPIPFDEVSQHIRTLSLLYKVEQVSYDPRYFAAPAQDLEAEGVPMVEVPQSPQRMVPLVGETYRAIIAKTLTHDAQPEYTAQVLNAQPHYGDTTGFTLSKAKSKTKAGERLHIDGAVATCLAVGSAVFVEPEQEVTDEMLAVY